MKKKICALFLMMIMVFVSVPTSAATTKKASKYWIKVNKQANVATVYQLKNGKYKAIKAMLVSCGGSNTPAGTFYTPAKYRWHTLEGPSYGQYCTRIYKGVLFHSVWYYSHSKASQSTKEFNKLGTTASHGCVRMAVIDAKWIYDNCDIGTKVTIYSSKNPGPLGKPKGIKVSTARKMYWDPTDPDKNNPYNKKKPTITISKKKASTVEYGSKYSVKSGVSAKQFNGVSLTSKVKYSVTKYNSKKKKYVKASFSTKKLGTYKIRYSVKSVGGASASKTFIVRVRDRKAPVITAKSKTIYRTAKVPNNATYGVTAKQKSGVNRTTVMNVFIKAPGAKKATKYSYKKAKAYKFNKMGAYRIRYEVANKYSPYKKAKKSVTWTVKYANATISINHSKIYLKEGIDHSLAKEAILAGITAKDYNGKAISKSKISLDLKKLDLKKAGTYEVSASVTGTSKTKITKKFKVKVEATTTEATTAVQETTTEATTTETTTTTTEAATTTTATP